MPKASRAIFSLSARKFHQKSYKPTINGLETSEALENAEVIPVLNPATGDQLSTVTSTPPALIAPTLRHIHETFISNTWHAPSSAQTRSRALSKLARLLESKISQLAVMETLQTGRAIREMNVQLGRLPAWLDYYAALIRTDSFSSIPPTQGNLLNYVQRVPLGVVAQITPFNHPLLIAVKKLAPALAAGNCVVIKPSEQAPITVFEFAKLAAEAGVPPGVITILPGRGLEIGPLIAGNPMVKKVDITAGTSTGRALGSIVGANLASYTAELGGKAPIVVFSDSALQNAINGVAFAAFVASGQTCVSGTRILVQENIYDKFMEGFLEKVAYVRRGMGDPLNPKSTMGSVISQTHLERVDAMVQRTVGGGKATLLAGGARMTGLSSLDEFDFSRGAFYPPTVISNVGIEDEIWQEEVFGPVVVVKQFKDESEAVHLANASKYGLGAGIWTNNLSRAHRVAAKIEAGLCWVNTHHRNDPSSPWGGMKESGVGRENGREAYLAYTQSKSTIVNIASPEESRETDDWFADSDQMKRYG
ncbi:aldehyde dehydrogenase domain-containing protein [Crepidotus variabilis]|uniref:Aldehyde dehydrogenase domain-containing protein n=1 Tax=Crepidotus variabilis TaxID=179855 RepID=A0A9P6ESV3_9AGAR|nr:aldehyde dehydrogenase domain-containing protein [Crepidotus variabilis]